MIRFLVDARLPPRLARALVEAGHEAEHVEDVGLRHGKDPAIWEYAMRERAVIVTKDEDFVDRFRRQVGGPVIVWLRVGNAANAFQHDPSRPMGSRTRRENHRQSSRTPSAACPPAGRRGGGRAMTARSGRGEMSCPQETTELRRLILREGQARAAGALRLTDDGSLLP